MTTMDATLIPYPCHPDNKPHRARRPVGAVLHHMAGYLPGTDGLFRDPDTGYATNLGIGSLDGQTYIVHEYVPEGEVAWGNGNDDLNARAISIEHENNRAQGYASKPTPEVHELSARTLARQARQWDWRIDGRVQLVLRDFPEHDFYDRDVPGFGVEFNVTGHRSVALKNCPNELDMAWIVARANQILTAPDPAQVVVKGRRVNMFTFIRNKKDGTIVLLNAERRTWRSLKLGEWAAYAANGWKYADLENGEYANVLAQFAPEPAPGVAS